MNPELPEQNQALISFQDDFLAFKKRLEEEGRPGDWPGYFGHLWTYLPCDAFPGHSQQEAFMRRFDEMGKPIRNTKPTPNNYKGISSLRQQQTNAEFLETFQRALIQAGLDLTRIKQMTQEDENIRTLKTTPEEKAQKWIKLQQKLHTYIMPGIEVMMAAGYKREDFY